LGRITGSSDTAVGKAGRPYTRSEGFTPIALTAIARIALAVVDLALADSHFLYLLMMFLIASFTSMP